MGGRVLIQITPQMRILVAIESIDGRKGIDSLAQLCREKLDADPRPRFLQTISRPFHYRFALCGNTLPGGGGPSPCR